jgi:murein DD-endopeptidase MepM/ murein hydrolase activator NlpD
MYFRLKTVFTVLALVIFSAACSRSDVHNKISLEVSDSTKQKNSNSLYGIPIDSFDLIQGHFKANTFLSDILVKYGISMQDIDILTKNYGNVFDVRNVRSGNDYVLFCDKDSTAKLRYLVYEHDASTSYIFSFNDSLNITRYKKEIIHLVKYASGTIETSLWDAIISGNLNPSLVNDLSDIFQWTVDFFGLQKGDSFKIIYEELYIDGEAIGTGKVLGACFNWMGSPIYAIPFIQNGQESFFDSEGKSLKKAFLKAPLQFSRISSRYSSSRMHPILRISRPHFGVDYAAPYGTPVYSIGDGRVISVATESGSGRIVKIQHNSVYSTAYMHLSRFEQGIKRGVSVKQGQIIGYVGTSGLSTGPHLDFRFYQNGSPVDPLKVDAPPVEPVSEANKARFEITKKVITDLIGTI